MKEHVRATRDNKVATEFESATDGCHWPLGCKHPLHRLSFSLTFLSDSSPFWETQISFPSRCRRWVRGESRQSKGSPHRHRCIYLVLSRCVWKRGRESRVANPIFSLCTAYKCTLSPALHFRRSKAPQSQTWEENLWRKALAGR